MKENKEKKRWGLILFIIFMMVGTSFSFVFFGFSGASENVKDRGIKFTKYPDRWEAKINGKYAAFSFLPSEVEDIFVQGESSNALKDKLEIDFTYDLNDTHGQSIALAQHQMELTLAVYDIFLRKGLTTNNSFDIPIITCKDATLAVPVLYFRQGNMTSIKIEGSCVIAEASKNTDFIRVKDRLAYGMLEILK
ncbi:MAG: hypothetical protein AABX33_08155 [Nanoarchaeota archaeon]